MKNITCVVDYAMLIHSKVIKQYFREDFLWIYEQFKIIEKSAHQSSQGLLWLAAHLAEKYCLLINLYDRHTCDNVDFLWPC